MGDTVKILVISDTHRNISNAIDTIIAKKPDYVLHLGDLAEDADELRDIFDRLEIIGVCGNCDWSSLARFSNDPSERMVDICGVKFFMSHGHAYSVKTGVEQFVATARGKGADVALFGHTHNPLLDHRGDIIIMNPGTVNTYGWIEITDGKPSARMCTFGE